MGFGAELKSRLIWVKIMRNSFINKELQIFKTFPIFPYLSQPLPIVPNLSQSATIVHNRSSTDRNTLLCEARYAGPWGPLRGRSRAGYRNTGYRNTDYSAPPCVACYAEQGRLPRRNGVCVMAGACG